MERERSSIIKIVERTLDCVDPRLMSHGRRVAFLTYGALKRHGGFGDGYMRDACILALLHDVGAYKTEEIDRMVTFETQEVWHHAIYGYLFLKYLSPLSRLSPSILFHHAHSAELSHLHPHHRDLAGIINIADRLDILDQVGSIELADAKGYFYAQSGLFDERALEIFFSRGWERAFEEADADHEFDEVLYHGGCTDKMSDAFMRTIVLSIDFRSPQTVAHTFGTAAASRFLAHRLGLPRDERERIATGAMLHDIGKIGIPQQVVEKNGKLTPDELKIMRQHANLTEKILSGNIDERIVRLACRHHEKLDGSGYPRGLAASDLTTGERLIAISDILSALCCARSYKDAFPKEKAVSIVQDMSRKGLIDRDIVNVAVENYDRLVAGMRRATAPVIRLYDKINAEFAELAERTKHFCKETGCGEIGAPPLLAKAV